MRRTIILFFIALVLVLGAAFIAFYLTTSENTGDSNGEGSGNFFSGLFPFGSGGSTPSENTNGNGDLPVTEDTRPVPQLRQVSNQPTVGAFLYTNEEDESIIRYIDRATGHIYDVPAEGRTATRISNTTVPEIYEVLWENENNFIIRYLNEDGDIENFYTTIDPEENEERAFSGSFMPEWQRGDIDPNKENLLAVYETEEGSVVTLSDVDGENERTIFSSAIRSWIPLQSDNALYVHTAPAVGVTGAVYQITNNTLTKIGEGVESLIAQVSPSGRYIVMSGGEREMTLSVYDTREDQIITASIDTIASKCAFTPDEEHLACGVPRETLSNTAAVNWLLGQTTFEDDLWLFTISDSVSTLLALPSDEVNAQIDVWNPRVSEDGNYVTFLNKNDLTLWSLRLQEPTESNDSEG